MLAGEPSTSSGCSPIHSSACASSVGKRPAACAASSASHKPAIAKHLRRLRAPQAGAIHGLCHQHARSARLSVSPPAWRAARRPRAMPLPISRRSRSCADRQGRAASCTSTQSSAARAPAQPCQRIAHRLTALRAARAAQSRRAGSGPFATTSGRPAASATANPGAAAIAMKRRQRPLDDGAAGERCVLLGDGLAESAAGAGRRHHEPVAHGAAAQRAGAARGAGARLGRRRIARDSCRYGGTT